MNCHHGKRENGSGYDSFVYSKTCLKRPLKRKTKIVLLVQLSLNAGQKELQNAPIGAFCSSLDRHFSYPLSERSLFCLF